MVRGKITASATVALAGLLGGGSLLVFGRFLYSGPLEIIDLGLSRGATLCLDAALSLLFFIQHSGMVRQSFRRRLKRLVHNEFHGALYSIASGVALLMVIIFWQQGAHLWSAPAGPVRMALRALFFLALAGFLWGGLSLRAFDPLGIGPLLARLRGAAPEEMPFSVRGAYRLVRHPLYLFSILIIWSSPELSTDRLLFNLLWSAWIVVGARLEERDLVAQFGDRYREYQRKVPMLLPVRFGRLKRRRSS